MEIFKLFGSIFVDNDKANESIDETDAKGEGLAGTFGKLGEAAGTVGTVLGGALAAGLGAAAVGIGALFVSGQDLQKSLNGLQAQTGATEDEMKGMEESLKNIYKNNYGESFQEIADTMAHAKNVTGAFGEDLQYLAQDALMLRDTFGYDMTESIRSADKLMKQYGLTGTDAMALIAEGSQKGLNYADDLLPTIDEYSVYFKQAGFSASEMFGLFQNAKNEGIFNLDYAADAIKEFGILMTEQGGDAAEVLNGMGLKGADLQKQFAKGGDGAKKALAEVAAALAAQKDPQKQYSDGVALFGTKFEDVGTKGILAMTKTNDSIKGSAEVLDSINKIKYNTISESFAGIGRIIQMGFLEPFQEKLMPVINEFANWAMGKLPTVKEQFQSFGSKVSEIFNAAMVYVGPVMDFIGAKVTEVITMIVSWWKENGADLLSNLQIIFNGIWGVIQFVMPAILLLIQSVWNNVKGVISGALNIISGLVKVFAGLFTGDFSKMWEGVKQLFLGAIQFIWNLVNLMMIGKLLGGFKAFISGGIGLFKSFGTAVKGTFRDFITNIVNLFGYFRATGSSIWSAMTTTIRNTVSTFVSAVKSNFGQIWSNAVSVFNNVKNAIINPIQTAKNTVKGVIDQIKVFFKSMKLELPKIKMPHFSIKNWSKNPVDWIKAMPSLDIDWYAKGTNYAPGGLAMVGENGPELMEIPRGAKIHTASETRSKVGQESESNKQQLILQIVTPEKHKVAEWLVDPITEFQEFNLNRTRVFEGR